MLAANVLPIVRRNRLRTQDRAETGTGQRAGLRTTQFVAHSHLRYEPREQLGVDVAAG